MASEPIIPMLPAVPVYLRVGEGAEHEIGRLNDPSELPTLLREVAAQIDFENTSKET